MAFVAGKDQYFTFNGLNLTGGYASEVKMSINGTEIEAAVIGQNWKNYLQGQSDIAFAVSGVFDDGTATTGLDAVLQGNLNAGGTKLWEYCPAGSASNKIKYSGNGFVTAYEAGGAVADKVGFSSNIRGGGSPTRTTLA